MINNYFKSNLNALNYAKSMIPTMKVLAEPLFANTPIYNFSYLKFYSNGNVINLTTDVNWIDYRFSENIKYKILFESELKDVELDKPYMYLWPTKIHDKLLGSLHHFGIWNGCNIYIPSLNQIEVFSFASTIDNVGMSNFYVNNFNILNHYIIYFREKITNLIEQEKKGHKILTDLTFPLMKPNCEIIKPTDYFYSWIKKDQKRIQMDNGVYLTNKETECCYYLSKGYSFKSIANKLNISARTIESHINNAKSKTNCHSKELLLQYINKKRWVFDSLFIE